MATMTPEAAFAKLEGYLLQIECPKEIINDVLSRADSATIEEFGLDSRDTLMLAFFIEEDYDISVDLAQITGTTKVSDLVTYIVGCAFGS